MSRFGDHPYLKTTFWMDSENHYWERDVYSEKTKEQMREWVAEKVKNEKHIANLQKPEANKNNYL